MKNIKLGSSDFDQLISFLSKHEAVLSNVIKYSKKEPTGVLIYLDQPLCRQVGDILTERLAIIGFDKNYELTEAGEKLEDFIDLFYYSD